MDDAKRVLEEMEARGSMPDGFTYNILFDGNSRCGDDEASLALYEEAIGKEVRFNNYSCSILLNGLFKEGKMEKAEEVLEKLIENGLVPDELLFYRCFQILEEMENKGMKPNVVSYGSLIHCLCKNGRLLEAEIILRDMVGREVLPNAQIYNMLIDGNCTAGKLKESFRFFEEMVKNGIGATLVTNNVLINGPCKRGTMIEAEDLVSQITSCGYNPNVLSHTTP
ncbi:hypothetical protein SO802_006995 [Lithocarpus litseifolius]|uniref:Pentatricopeptide repeat-containing protein n=1 Tax=Lithocarpus litseifolius TaxID=425828 RepID=A0AAW2DME4_9ROSI